MLKLVIIITLTVSMQNSNNDNCEYYVLKVLASVRKVLARVARITRTICLV